MKPKKHHSRLRVLADIRKHQSTTVREIGERVGLTPPTVWAHLKNLESEGLVTWEPGKARTIRPTKTG